MIKTWMQSKNILSKNILFVILHDLLAIPCAWFGAFWLRFNLDGIPDDALLIAYQQLPILFLVQTAAFWTMGLYRGVWRFASLPDLMRIFRAVLIGSVVALLILFMNTRLQGLPRSVFPLYSMALILILGGSRFAVRWIKDYKRNNSDAKRVLVVGAGVAAESLVRELLRGQQYFPVGFVDNQRSKNGQEIHGIRVLGKLSDIQSLVKSQRIDLIIIAIPDAKADEMRLIMNHCEGTAAMVRTLPGVNDLVSGRVSLDLLREVSLEDLLGRDPVQLDWAAIEGAISQKIVLVTGGGGSIGSELCRQIAKLKPSKLIVVERVEFNLFNLERELQETFPELPIAMHLMDVTDASAMQYVLSEYSPEIIFHAAAFKHVPLLQFQPREAIQNNILGTRTLAELALKNRVLKFVLVSTDKAVNPTNVMGATKRVTEMVCEGLNGKGVTQFITVRFGNVLGSAGSVVPIFKEQLEKGGPITVTHKEIMRYFMTIPEACQLILQATTMGQGGEIFVLDMGAPIKIRYLAEQMIRLAGKIVDEDIKIVYTGLRPGEKLFEELFHPSEHLTPTSHNKILQAAAREINIGTLNRVIDAMSLACQSYEIDALMALLKQLVPELNKSEESVSV